MFKKMLCKVVSVIRRMNQWWDKDEEKEIAAVISGIIILAGILILNKAILFIIALILIINRVIHRFNLWTSWECDVSGQPVSSSLSEEDYDDTSRELTEDDLEEIIESKIEDN